MCVDGGGKREKSMEKKGGCIQGNGLWLGEGRPLLITKHGSMRLTRQRRVSI